MKGLTIGVLGLQGDIEEHVLSTEMALKKMTLQGRVVVAKKPQEIDVLDGLVIPGGESTVQGALSTLNRTISSVRERILNGMPAMGTCAGIVVLAKHVTDHLAGETKQPLMGALDVDIERNSFGRQAESFEADLEIPIMGERRFRGVFIRAPTIKDIDTGVDVLSKLGAQTVAVQQRNILGLTFHPELAADTRLHEHFLRMIAERRQ